MADNRKYYYLKLKENFFDSDSIVLLEDMKDGILYSNILLKLYLKSLKHGGQLQLDEHIPYTCLLYTSLCFRAGFVIDGFYEECFKTNKEIPMVMIVRLKKVKRDSLK